MTAHLRIPTAVSRFHVDCGKHHYFAYFRAVCITVYYIMGFVKLRLCVSMSDVHFDLCYGTWFAIHVCQPVVYEGATNCCDPQFFVEIAS